ncbi:MAG: radical SAM protein [Oscillospiraceae bacterium]|nr:radical SAM protein [Oscillospiraceae bacterium]
MKEIRKKDPVLERLLPPQTPQTGVLYLPSQFALPFESAGESFCYHTLTGQCLQGALPQSARAGCGFDEWIKALFLVPEGRDECAFYLSVSSLARTFCRKKGSDTFILMPTLGCNAHCGYCYENGMERTSMSDETARQVVRCISKACDGKHVKLRWIGGEPLLCPQVLDRICEGLRENGVMFRSSMVSNGSLLTPQILAQMTGLWNLQHIQISMDGAEQDYISRKRYLPDREEYHKVIDAVACLSDAGIPVTIRCNVDEENLDRAPRLLRDLERGVRAREHVGFYFALLNDARAGDRDLLLWKKILEFRPLIRAAGFRDEAYPGLDGRFRVNHCMADGNGTVIGPDGSLYACEQCPPGSRYGDVWNGVTDENARREFCEVNTVRPSCRKCPFLPSCTSFSHCPDRDAHCRQVRELWALDALRRLTQSGPGAVSPGEAFPVT